MAVLIIIIQWLHVILGITWFGSNIYANTVVIPTVSKLSIKEQQKIGGLIGPATARVMLPVSILVVVFGFLRGTVFGQVHSFGYLFGSAYGITWLISLLLGIGWIMWGEFVISPRGKALNTAKTEKEFSKAFSELKIYAPLEVIGFLALFTCMILMHFGY